MSKKIISIQDIVSILLIISIIGLSVSTTLASTFSTATKRSTIYSSSSTSSSTYAIVEIGQNVKVISTSGNWCKITWESTGYAHKNYVNKSSGRVIGEGPNIRKSPSQSGLLIGSISSGSVKILGTSGNYYKVSFSITGYTLKNNLNIANNSSVNLPKSSTSSSNTLLGALLNISVKGIIATINLSNNLITSLFSKNNLTNHEPKTIETVVEDNYEYNFNNSTYKIGISQNALNATLNVIDNNNITQQYLKSIDKNTFKNSCKYISYYHSELLLNKINRNNVTLNNAKTSIANKTSNSYLNENRFKLSTFKAIYSKIKNIIDNKSLGILHVRSSSSEHWVTIVGYKDNCEKLNDLLILGSYYGELIKNPTSNIETINGLYSDYRLEQVY